MYLNFDLLCNSYKFLYPLYYYRWNKNSEVYSPATKKSIYFSQFRLEYVCDFITFKSHKYQ